MAWNSQYNGGFGGLSQKFPMKSMDQCEKAKIEFIEVLRKNEGGQKVERPLLVVQIIDTILFVLKFLNK